MAISAKEQALSKTFTSDFRFTVPPFQRAYQWKREQMAQLIDDIVDACRNGEPYFLGSLILVHNGGSKYDVIDGQQRLVSLTILFAVLLDLENDHGYGDKLHELIMEPGDKLRGIEPEPRLKLRDQDAQFFREHVQSGNLESLFDLREQECETQAQKNIVSNTRYAYDQLGQMNNDERHEFLKFLVNHIMLVIVTTDDIAGAYRIFDVMNMRGLPLTASDVFKAKTVAHIPSSLRDAYAQFWDAIMEPFGDDATKIEHFFTDLYLVITGKPMCEQLLNDFSQSVLAPYFQGDRGTEFIDRILRPYASAWNVIDHASRSVFPDSIQHGLAKFHDYPVHDWRPVAMWAIVHSVSNIEDPDVSLLGNGNTAPLVHDIPRLEEILTALDRVTGVFALNSVSTLERRTAMSKAVRDLRNGLAVQRVTGFLVSAHDQRVAMMRLRGELTMNDDMKRVLLIRANEQLTGRPITRPRSLNTVHILPEHISKHSTFASWPADICDFWSERIGNLTLTQAGAKTVEPLEDFQARRARILADPTSRRFPLTAQLEDLAQLTPEALERRQQETVTLIAQAWNLRYDEHHVDLTLVSDETLRRSTSHKARPNSRHVSVREVVNAGLLAVGETLVWERPRKRERWEITVTAQGLRLPDGREVATPTAAARAVTNGTGASGGLNVWKRTSDGESLGAIWKKYREQVR